MAEYVMSSNQRHQLPLTSEKPVKIALLLSPKTFNILPIDLQNYTSSMVNTF